MFLGIRKKYWWYLVATLAMVGLMVFLNLSPVFALREAEFKGPFAGKLEDLSQSCLQSNENLFRLDKNRLAEALLGHDGVENINLSVDLPRGLRGEVNQFEPEALIITERLYGLDRCGRLIPYDRTWEGVNLPVMTGLKGNRLFHAPDDYRAAEVMVGLLKIKDELPELYRQIAEIDFTDRVYVGIYLTTGTDRYLAASRNFATQLFKLDVVNRAVARSEGGCYNLMYDDVVVKQK
jgi:cell division septal protein FtsQ